VRRERGCAVSRRVSRLNERLSEHARHTFPVRNRKSDQGEYTMKSLAFLEQVDRNRKVAIYAAAHDGKMRNFAYREGHGECRETFSRLVHDVQTGEIGVVMTPDTACLSVETSPGWMEAFIQTVKQHNVLIGDHSHDLVYDLCHEEDEVRFRSLYPRGEYEKARSAPAHSSMRSPRAPSPPRSKRERTGSWSRASRESTRTHPSIVFPAGQKGKMWTCWG